MVRSVICHWLTLHCQPDQISAVAGLQEGTFVRCPTRTLMTARHMCLAASGLGGQWRKSWEDHGGHDATVCVVVSSGSCSLYGSARRLRRPPRTRDSRRGTEGARVLPRDGGRHEPGGAVALVRMARGAPPPAAANDDGGEAMAAMTSDGDNRYAHTAADSRDDCRVGRDGSGAAGYEQVCANCSWA